MQRKRWSSFRTELSGHANQNVVDYYTTMYEQLQATLISLFSMKTNVVDQPYIPALEQCTRTALGWPSHTIPPPAILNFTLLPRWRE